MAEVAAAKAKADEAQEDGINEAARDALQAIKNPNAMDPERQRLYHPWW